MTLGRNSIKESSITSLSWRAFFVIRCTFRPPILIRLFFHARQRREITDEIQRSFAIQINSQIQKKNIILEKLNTAVAL